MRLQYLSWPDVQTFSSDGCFSVPPMGGYRAACVYVNKAMLRHSGDPECQCESKRPYIEVNAVADGASRSNLTMADCLRIGSWIAAGFHGSICPYRCFLDRELPVARRATAAMRVVAVAERVSTNSSQPSPRICRRVTGY